MSFISSSKRTSEYSSVVLRGLKDDEVVFQKRTDMIARQWGCSVLYSA